MHLSFAIITSITCTTLGASAKKQPNNKQREVKDGPGQFNRVSVLRHVDAARRYIRCCDAADTETCSRAAAASGICVFRSERARTDRNSRTLLAARHPHSSSLRVVLKQQ